MPDTMDDRLKRLERDLDVLRSTQEIHASTSHCWRMYEDGGAEPGQPRGDRVHRQPARQWTGRVGVVRANVSREGVAWPTNAWTGRPSPDTILRALFMPDSYFNAGETTPDNVMVEAISVGSNAQSPENRAEAYGQLLDRLYEEALFDPLRWAPTGYIMRDTVEEFESSLLGTPRFDEVWLQQWYGDVVVSVGWIMRSALR